MEQQEEKKSIEWNKTSPEKVQKINFIIGLISIIIFSSFIVHAWINGKYDNIQTLIEYIIGMIVYIAIFGTSLYAKLTQRKSDENKAKIWEDNANAINCGHENSFIKLWKKIIKIEVIRELATIYFFSLIVFLLVLGEKFYHTNIKVFLLFFSIPGVVYFIYKIIKTLIKWIGKGIKNLGH